MLHAMAIHDTFAHVVPDRGDSTNARIPIYIDDPHTEANSEEIEAAKLDFAHALVKIAYQARCESQQN